MRTKRAPSVQGCGGLRVEGVLVARERDAMIGFSYPEVPDVDAYLALLGLQRPEKPDLEFLDELIYRHQLTVPFDTMDTYLTKQLAPLDIDVLFQKVVYEHRGGYCFQLNSLFCSLLVSLGYNAWGVFARVYIGPFMSGVGHRGTVVNIDGKKYFLDVGCGGAMPSFAVEIGGPKRTVHGETYWTELRDDQWYELRRYRSNGALDEGGKPIEAITCFFIPEPALNSDFEPLNFMMSGTPESSYCKAPKLNKRLEDGFISFAKGKFVEMRNGVRTEVDMDPTELDDAVLARFGIVLK